MKDVITACMEQVKASEFTPTTIILPAGKIPLLKAWKLFKRYKGTKGHERRIREARIQEIMKGQIVWYLKWTKQWPWY